MKNALYILIMFVLVSSCSTSRHYKIDAIRNTQRPISFRDPVCGKEVLVTDSTSHAAYKGQIYYFDLKACRKEFLRHPLHYKYPLLAENSTRDVAQVVVGNAMIWAIIFIISSNIIMH